jgi:ABC-type phosphate transport system auxiliary subunit
MKPEELFDPETMPEDLQWVITHYRLQPNDPVFLLIAWHWNRVKACEDTVKLAIVELRSILDARVEALADAADTVTGVNTMLAEVQAVLEEKPAQLAKQLDAELKQPIADAVSQLQALEKSLAPLARNFQTAQRRQLLAALLIGVTLGVLSSIIVLLA